MNCSTYIVVCTYIVIFKKLFESGRDTQSNLENDPFSNNMCMFFWRELRRGGFIIPLLITFTYLLFVVVPILIVGFYYIFGDVYDFFPIWLISYNVNNICDVLMYVFCDKDIQNHLKNTFRRCGRSDQNNNNGNGIELNAVNASNRTS